MWLLHVLQVTSRLRRKWVRGIRGGGEGGEEGLELRLRSTMRRGKCKGSHDPSDVDTVRCNGCKPEEARGRDSMPVHQDSSCGEREGQRHGDHVQAAQKDSSHKATRGCAYLRLLRLRALLHVVPKPAHLRHVLAPCAITRQGVTRMCVARACTCEPRAVVHRAAPPLAHVYRRNLHRVTVRTQGGGGGERGRVGER